MSKSLDEIAGARCSFCRVGAEETPDKRMIRGLRGYICTACAAKCKALLKEKGAVIRFRR